MERIAKIILIQHSLQSVILNKDDEQEKGIARLITRLQMLLT